MTDPRTPERPPEDEFEHDEYHSSLEVDDSTGWRVFVIPGVLILLVIAMIAAFVIYEDEAAPDPRIADRLGAEAEEAQPVQPARVPAIQPEAMTPAETEAAPAEAEAAQPAE